MQKYRFISIFFSILSTAIFESRKFLFKIPIIHYAVTNFKMMLSVPCFKKQLIKKEKDEITVFKECIKSNSEIARILNGLYNGVSFSLWVMMILMIIYS